jgi:hypothetical protein
MSRESHVLFGEESVQAAVLAPSGILKALLKCIKISPDTSQGEVKPRSARARMAIIRLRARRIFWKVAARSIFARLRESHLRANLS